MTIELNFTMDRGPLNLDITLSVPATGVTAVLGPSGSGKTTLLRVISGLEKARSGTVEVCGIYWQNDRFHLPTHRRLVGYVSQDDTLFPHLSVEKNLLFGFRRTPAPQQTICFEQVVQLLEMKPLLSRRPGTLSGGEKRRVALGRALLASPRLLLMDEPLTGLDRRNKSEILSYLDVLFKDLHVPVFYVSHDTDEVARIAETLVLLERGKVLGSGPVAEMLARSDLPLIHESDAEALLKAVIVRHEQEHSLTVLEIAGGTLQVPLQPSKPGEHVRVRITARDVSLTLSHQLDTSILNILQGVVLDVLEEGSSQAMVRLNISGAVILSRVTRKSVQSLGLKPGAKVYAQIKGVAVLA